MPKASRPEIISEQFRKPLFYVAVVLAALVLHKPIETLLESTFVKPFLGEIDRTWYNDLLWGLAILAILYYTYRKIKLDYHPSVSLRGVWTSLALVYSVYRGFYPYWEFQSLVYLPRFYYFDFIYALMLSSWLMTLKSKTKLFFYLENAWARLMKPFKKIADKIKAWKLTTAVTSIWVWIKGHVQRLISKYVVANAKRLFIWLKGFFEPLEENSDNTSLDTSNQIFPFEVDVPKKEIDDDQLRYNPYVASLASKILVTKADSAFAIGINAQWGTGKTTFMNFLQRELEDKVITVEFNPWNSHTPGAIIQDFLETFQTALFPYHSALSKLLRAYSNKLASLNDDNTAAQYTQIAVSAVLGYDSLGRLHGDIDKALKEIGRKVVVYIDDLDRLDSPEIVEVLKLIRNTANFSNTFFIVAYDREYVMNAIHNHGIHNKEHFLEKIFQLEIMLPMINKSTLLQEFARLVYKETPFSQCYKFIGNNRDLFLWGLDNMRDVKRLSNSYSLNIANLKTEVLYDDFLLLELLRLKYPQIYQLYSQKRFIYIYNGNENSYYTLYDKDAIRSIIRSDKIDVLKRDIQVVEKILKLLNRDIEPDNKTFVRAVRNPVRFLLYFQYSLGDSDFSELEFVIARSRLVDSYQYLETFISKDTTDKLLLRLMKEGDFSNIQDFEWFIELLVHTLNYVSNISSQWDTYSFNKPIYQFVEKQRMVLYSNGKENILKDFLKRLYLSIDIMSRLVLNSLINFRVSIIQDKEKALFSDIELRSIGYDCLTNYITKSEKLDYYIVMWLFYVSSNEEGSPNRFKPNKMAQEYILRNAVSKDLDGLLVFLTQTQLINGINYISFEFINWMFEDTDKFIEYLNKYNGESKYKDNFIELMNKERELNSQDAFINTKNKEMEPIFSVEFKNAIAQKRDAYGLG